MAYEVTPFGADTASTTRVTSVHNQFGPRKSDRAQGVVKTEGSVRMLSVEISGEDVGNAAYPLLAPSLPAGAVIKNAWVTVKEAFVVGGTSPLINVGTEGSESTNGLDVSEARAEAVGTYDVTSTLAGTWAAPLAAATTVGLSMSGTSPTVTDAGLMEVVIEYFAPNA